MVIRDFDIIRIAVIPAKTNSPLVIDSNAVLAFPIANQFLKTIRWWNTKVFQGISSIEHHELSQCRSLDIPRELLNSLAPK